MHRIGPHFAIAFALGGLACGSTGSGTEVGDDTEAGDESGPDETSGTEGDDTEGDETGTTGEPPDPVTMVIFEEVTFYDGYAEPVDEPVPEGVIRHSNALYATMLEDDQLDAVQNTLFMNVTIGALCDNYDRIGGVFMSLVPKGDEDYEPAEVPRFEIARFITPFMNKNKSPTTVPFDYDLGHVVPMLKNEAVRAEYDIWLELHVFGVPYAANNEVPGCDGRNDVFRGRLTLDSDSTQDAAEFSFATPLADSEAFNNHQEGASDELGTTRKTLEFELEEDTEATQLVLVTSNHGANQGGEEYNRREHYVYVDGNLALQYKPGRETCEPFRMYNTQGNGIYGAVPKSDEEWQSFSNWCPGDVIDNRIIELGGLDAGTHEFVIDVPDAIFANGEGNFPFSLYVQGR